MSRVDRALEIWERKNGATAGAERPDASANEPTTHSFHLNGYARENAIRDEPPPVAEAFGAPLPPAPLTPQASSQSPDPIRPQRSAPIRPVVSTELTARLVNGGSGAVPVEQYRRLAAVLHDLQLQQGLKTLMLTSALPSEGKTLTTVNLALTLSESYERRVLLIDADLRWPCVHKMFGLVNDAGLSEFLQNDRKDFPTCQVSARLSVLTAGRPGVTPLAGLTSTKMAALLEECAEQFDWVLLDTPPVGLLPDAQPLARLTRAVVFVIAADVTPEAAVRRAVTELGSDCIIGTVLNRVDERRIPSAGYYYSRYGSSNES